MTPQKKTFQELTFHENNFFFFLKIVKQGKERNKKGVLNGKRILLEWK